MAVTGNDKFNIDRYIDRLRHKVKDDPEVEIFAPFLPKNKEYDEYLIKQLNDNCFKLTEPRRGVRFITRAYGQETEK